MIFGIGLTKTGTTSLTEALKILGYNSIHIGTNVLEEDLTLKMDIIAKYDAVTDTPLINNYKLLDTGFPNSKFILTIRDLNSWVESNRDWFDLEKQMHNYDYHKLHTAIYGDISFNYSNFVTKYFSHYNDVLEYFGCDNPNLLIMDICKGDSWEVLCKFLDKPVPDVEFPIRNSRNFIYTSALNNIVKSYSRGSISIFDYNVIVKYCKERDFVCELGTNIGTTTKILSEIAKQVMTVDVFEDINLIKNEEQRKIYRTSFENNKNYYAHVKSWLNKADNILIIKCESASASNFVDDCAIDTLLIDADHSYEGVKNDYNSWLCKVKNNGYLLLHDAVKSMPGVFKFYIELLNDTRVTNVVDPITTGSSIKIFKKESRNG